MVRNDWSLNAYTDHDSTDLKNLLGVYGNGRLSSQVWSILHQDSAKSVNMVLIFEGQGALYPEEAESAFPNE